MHVNITFMARLMLARTASAGPKQRCRLHQLHHTRAHNMLLRSLRHTACD